MDIYAFTSSLEKALNDRNITNVLAHWAEPMDFVAPGERATGREALIAREENLWTGFPDIYTRMVPVAETGNIGVVRVDLTGTHEGKPVTIESIVVFTFENDKVISERAFYDRLEVAELLQA